MERTGHFDEVAVTIQPGSGFAGTGYGAIPDDWMPKPQHDRIPVNCPPGLEHIATMDEIYIQQMIMWQEIFLGCEWNQKYEITDPASGKILYKAKEDTPCCTRMWCANARPMELSITDHEEKEVLHLSRPFHCAGLMCPPCMDEFNISTPDGKLLGSVRQVFVCCVPKFNVYDANGEVVLNIQGPCRYCSCCDDVPFQIYSPGERTEVGAIVKRWTGAVKELCTDVDNFRIAFPRNLDVRIKACLVGACISIDLLYYENKNK